MEVHAAFLQTLTAEEEQLIIIRDFLYDGDWQEVILDLRGRQQGKPYIFKLNSRIDEDLQRIAKLQQYEMTHGINLGALLVKSGKFPDLSQGLMGPAEHDAQNQAAKT